MAQDIADVNPVDPLDRTIDLTAIRWSMVVAVTAVIAGLFLRFTQLDEHALSKTEARWAYDAYLFFRGESPDPGQSLPTTSPVTLVANGASFFLFGVTDATA